MSARRFLVVSSLVAGAEEESSLCSGKSRCGSLFCEQLAFEGQARGHRILASRCISAQSRWRCLLFMEQLAARRPALGRLASAESLRSEVEQAEVEVVDSTGCRRPCAGQ